MTWVFAILIVLVLGGIAAVAVGRGAPMDPATTDRPDALVPATGPVTGRDLRAIRFPLVLRGYRMAEVDALLDRLAEQLDGQPWRPPAPDGAEVPESVTDDAEDAEDADDDASWADGARTTRRDPT